MLVLLLLVLLFVLLLLVLLILVFLLFLLLFLLLLQLPQGKFQVLLGFQIIRVQAQGFLVDLDGGFELLGLEEGIAQIVVTVLVEVSPGALH